MLAGRALKSETNSTYHIDELLQLFPSLQYGMDVNPKFTKGPTGVEYTTGLSAFDLMGVELVHGWLIDALDEHYGNVVGPKTYNELTEMMIMGNEASEKIEKIETEIRELQKQIPGEEETQGETQKDSADIDLESILDQIRTLEQERDLQNKNFQEGSIIEEFLSTTGTQLTFAGLTELHNHVKEGAMMVFFRNNHFSTMTKHDGILYLLITDLGYQNAPEVLWEKLDDISGDTEYADQDFVRTKPAAQLISSGPTLSPEQLLAQSGRAEADYQLALQLSRNDRAIDDQEGKLIAAATAASLEQYNNEQNGIPTEITNDLSASDNNANGQSDDGNNLSASLAAAREEQDKIIAMQLQRQFEEDDARQRMSQQGRAQTPANNVRDSKLKKESACIIS